MIYTKYFEDMKMSSIEQLNTALAAAHGEFPPIVRDKEVSVKTKTGGTYKFKYAPLESIIAAVRPALSRHGLSITQTVSGNELVSTLLHANGAQIESRVAILFTSGTAQEYGSALTYARRYGLTLLLNVSADDDDDGNLASGNEVTASREVTRKSERDDAYARAIAEATTREELDAVGRTIALDPGVNKDYLKRLYFAALKELKGKVEEKADE